MAKKQEMRSKVLNITYSQCNKVSIFSNYIIGGKWKIKKKKQKNF